MIDGEEKLIQDAVGGDASAFGQLYDHYQPMIYRFVFVKVGQREEAEDITHKVFFNAWRNIRNYRNEGRPFGSLLYRMARNQIIDSYRARRDEISIENVDAESLSSSADPHSDVLHKLEVEKVMVAIAKLKPDYQDVIILRFIEDLPVRETALAMKKTEGSIKLMQHRAIEELKKILAKSE
jgi:RNA polymerase sigma-70 factor (ECF subfamily)